jgi:uncharacterized SAM-binding protein YcdF (DUF218 family)
MTSRILVPFITWLFSPFAIVLFGLCLYLTLSYIPALKQFKKTRFRILICATIFLFLFSQPLLVSIVGVWLEQPFSYIDPSLQPKCDAIVLLGGGMGVPRSEGGIPEMFSSADRVWHAARLWHASKAPHIVISGVAEEKSSKVLLRDLGVPESAIIVEGRSFNTIENALYTYELLIEKQKGLEILLVTSAKHMRRSMMIFKTLGVKPVSAAVDHEATYGSWLSIKDSGVSIWHILPSPAALNCAYFYYKECIGLMGDRIRVKYVVGQIIED